ncbi:hypothetical protein SUGI_0320540 [Cryptomeria japonica]|uniref:putative ABC transporter C family member 15 n=1 Tax=Cryptomeria japonica TaxID=3369 RepID=UPI002408C848|nr:putative ABC transporter C family member 15 [Cryptomeria japonica]XP_057851272.2 putative ABC transporter C family member 15 [Cryptomeria japonica]GLJ18146.1 hypothetical protein SUGI_0320540 [Cryptomeria japonica]
MGGSVQVGGVQDLIVRVSFRHGVVISCQLIFVIALLVRKWAVRLNNRECHVPLEKKTRGKIQLGFRYKGILTCCISLAVFYTLFAIWRPLYWWLNERPKDYEAEGEYIVQAIAWSTMAFSAYQSPTETRKDKLPILLRVWWIILFIVYAVFFLFDILLLREKEVFPTSIWVDLLGLAISSFLCYVGCHGRIGGDSFGEGMHEPLLDGFSEKSGNPKPVTPYATAGILSRMSFSWMSTLFSVGFKKPLQIDDVPQVAGMDSAEEVYNVFRDRLEAEGILDTQSMAKATLMSVWKEVILSAFFAAAYSFAAYVGPSLIDAFVQYLNGNQQFQYQGYALACTFIVAMLVESLAQRHLFFKLQQIGLHSKVSFMAAIYRKGLRLSSQSKQKHTSGEIINYMSVDAERIGDFSWYLHEFWNVPLQVFLGLFILYKSLGLASLAGLAATVIVMIGNLPIGNLQEKFQDEIMEAKDERMRATAETLRNMRILKLQAWETRFLLKLENLRKVECGCLKKYLFTESMLSFAFWGAPTVVSIVTFGACMLMGVPLTAGKILSALATFRLLQDPIYNLPEFISMVAQTKVSLDRVAIFLKEEELQYDAVEQISKGTTDIAVHIQGGEFSWDPAPSSSTLRGIQLCVERGMTVAICGTVGSGKSSLLATILGEIPRVSGTVRLSGTKAYVAQSPWIQSCKIEENILFGKQMERVRYECILEACALKKDIESFAYGDQTEIGERGINLSGGQKQRVQLARALYQDADIYLLDDPFSAVDVHTGTHIFKECILGILSKKTVFYVTHQVEFLPTADLILVMRDGKITQAGRYSDILQSGTDFLELVGAHQKALDTMDANENSHHIGVSSEIDTVESDNLNNSLLNEANPKVLWIEGNVEISRGDNDWEERNKSASDADPENKKAQLVQEEERETGRVSIHVYWSYITAAYKGWLTPFIILSQMMFQLLQIGSDYWMAWANPTTLGDRSPISNSLLIRVYIALSLGSSLFVLIRAMLLSVIAFKAANQLFSKMHRCIFRAPMSFFDSTPSGRILNRVSTDQSAVDLTIPFQLGAFAFAVIRLIGIIGVMSQVAWQIFLMFIPVAAISIWYQQYYIITARELARLVGVFKAPILQHFSESISGAMTIRSFDQEDRFVKNLFCLLDVFSQPSFHGAAAMEWLCFRLDLLSTFVFGFSMVFLVSLPQGVINASIAGLGITYGLNLNSLQAWMIWNFCNVENKIISVERILQYSCLPSEAPLVIEKSRPNFDWPVKGTIELYDLQVRYGPHLPLVLKGLTCTFPGGMKVGVVGRTGSGKSTLIQALFRIVEPARGKILIDNVDVSEIGLHDLRSKLSIIPQDPTMFEGSIRTNLDPLEDRSDAEIWEALKKCQLEELVRAKENKLDSLVTENGENWSVGQRQLVCLGRALLKHSRILMLDEATASVDTATDGLIQYTLRNQFSDCTVITIAHRIPTVIDSDLVLVLDNGQISEYDSPKKLLEDNSSSFLKLVSEYSLRSNNLF